MGFSSEKDQLPAPPAAMTRQRTRLWPRALLAILGAAAIYSKINRHWSQAATGASPMCPQTEALHPQRAALVEDLDALYASEGFFTKSVEWLGGAVRVPTESYDVMGKPEEDPRWKVFGKFHEYLEGAFPLVHANLKLTKVNTWALVYTWEGTDESLKPILLAAHQDVVPVLPETIPQWLNPPYSGLFDGEWIWGRGSCDDKSGLIGIMGAVESMLEKGFKPARTVVLGFGFDEETGGKEGAMAIGQYLLKEFGEGSFSMLVDEGGGFGDTEGIAVATPAVAEKGYLDVHVQVNTPGGHSSVPPAHTGIGILASIITTLESNPMTPHLVRSSPIYEQLQCLAAHAPDLPKSYRRTIERAAKSDKALRKVEDVLFAQPQMRAAAGTTQAVDIISGGVKINALPEQVYAVVNHRIAIDSSPDELMARFKKLLAPVADTYNLTLSAFEEGEPKQGSITLSEAWHSALRPAPRTPTDPDAKPYALLAGTIKAAYATSHAKDIVVAPGMSTGNTDTKRYWGLTKHIFRYGHRGRGDGFNGAHTINEALRARSFPDVIRFYTYLILNADESKDID